MTRAAASASARASARFPARRSRSARASRQAASIAGGRQVPAQSAAPCGALAARDGHSTSSIRSWARGSPGDSASTRRQRRARAGDVAQVEQNLGPRHLGRQKRRRDDARRVERPRGARRDRPPGRAPGPACRADSGMPAGRPPRPPPDAGPPHDRRSARPGAPCALRGHRRRAVRATVGQPEAKQDLLRLGRRRRAVVERQPRVGERQRRRLGPARPAAGHQPAPQRLRAPQIGHAPPIEGRRQLGVELAVDRPLPGMDERRHRPRPDGRDRQHPRRAAHVDMVYRQTGAPSKTRPPDARRPQSPPLAYAPTAEPTRRGPHCGVGWEP